jgi:DNA-binding NarL/FixJ family response regulator
MPSVPPLGRVRVLLADDQRLFAESLMAVLSEDERVDVVGIAENGEDAVKLAAELQPDVVLMDLKMPVMDGLEATRRIRETGLPVQILLLTGTETQVGAQDAAEAGASAFMRKERGVEELRQVLVEVASLAAVLGAPAR